MHHVRRLKTGEAALYRAIRLESLKDSPEAFATSYQSALGREESSWAGQADESAQGHDRATFVVLTDRPIGLAALYRDPNDSLVGELIQMWIAPDFRGSSIATDLLDCLFGWAMENQFGIIRADVTAGNERALRFYRRYGFCEVATEGTNRRLTKDMVRRI